MVLQVAVSTGLRGAAASGASKALAKCPGIHQQQAHHHEAQHARQRRTSSCAHQQRQRPRPVSTAVASAASRWHGDGMAMLRGPSATDQGLPLQLHVHTDEEDELPRELYNLLEASAPVQLPLAAATDLSLDNWKLDKLVAQLGRSKATWRRAVVLYEWLKDSGHRLDDRLCTTLIRLCGDHRDAMTALSVYDWMRAPAAAGGGDLSPTVFTYTAAMRAALNGGLLDRALKVWDDCEASGTRPDSRLCVAFMDVCTRLGATDRALGMYAAMRAGPPRAPCPPTVHAYTAAMRAASEGGRWQRALDIWADLRGAHVGPTAHAFAAAISACAAGREWRRAAELFEEMAASGITPDVVSSTALVSALAAGGQADKAEAVVQWMLRIGLQPNVRTYTSLMSAMASAQQCSRAVEVLYKMQLPEWGAVSPNAYSYSVLIKALGDAGYWQLAEAVFGHAEQAVLARRGAAAATGAAAAEGPAEAAAAGRRPPVARASSASTTPSPPSSSSPASIPAPLRAEATRRAPAWSSASQLNGISVNIVAPPSRPTSGGAGASGVLGGRGDDATAVTQPSFSLFSGRGGAGVVLQAGPRPKQHAVQPRAHGAPAPSTEGRAAAAASAAASVEQAQAQASPVDCPMNEVVCGSMMLAYERAGMWAESLGVLGRAAAMGVPPNTVMYNTALAAVGKAGQLELAESVFRSVPSPDSVTYESLIAAYGLCGQPAKAEGALRRMLRRGFRPRDYAYCGLIAAHSLAGDVDGALAVRRRVRQGGGSVSIHVYNALLAACERGGRSETALKLLAAMKKEGLEPNGVTNMLMSAVGRQGVQSVEGQQAALAAISAAVAAAGGILMSRGVF